MADLADFFRWQWLWRSRRRLFVIGLVVFLLGAGILALLIVTAFWWRPNANIARGIPLPFVMMAIGGYGMLQALLSGGGAFGDHDHDDSRDGRRRAWRRQRRLEPTEVGPIPLVDTAEAEPLKKARCPVCEVLLPASPAEEVECPKCLQRFRVN